MSEVLQILGYISEFITTMVGLFLMVIIIKRDPKYTGNILMGLAVGSVGLYTGFIFIYDIIAEPWAILMFLPLAMITILFGSMLMFFTFKILSESTKWFDNKKKWLPYPIIVLVYSIWILTVDFITIENLEVVKTQIDLAPLIVMVLILLFFLFKTAYEINIVGLKQSEGKTHDRMKMFLYGIYVMILAVVLNIPSHIFDGMEVLTVIFFYVILAGELIFAYAFLKR